MKKLLIGIASIILFACNSGTGGEKGVINDGMNAVDTNGALNDRGGPLTDSTNNAIENKTRVDIQQRDTFTNKGQ